MGTAPVQTGAKMDRPLDFEPVKNSVQENLICLLTISNFQVKIELFIETSSVHLKS